MTASSSSKPEPSRLATTILSVLGTVAGVTFALYLVGVLFEFRRLKTLGLPADQPVSAMPHDLLLVIGVRSLLVPLSVALATVAARVLLSLAASQTAGRFARTQLWLTTAGLAGIAAAAIAFVVVPHGRLRIEHLTFAATGAALLGATRYGDGRWRWLRRPNLALFVCTLLLGIAVAYEHAMHPPVHFDRATVFFAHGQPQSGFYIGRDSDEIFLAPSVGNATCRVLDVVFTKDVTRIALRRGKAIRGAVPHDGKCTKD